ncbi:SGNH/GDSL hydrolase family protein [Butyrivibrio sp. TB]|uniref:SGNH/GDSL hydrolase family protein n=1 Tax=Butyrivibrio sp. TB TaxID=1520809 RepID=UPI0008B5AD4D|nr:SGNH/GDSL hydrolase family protein [Butyrivibrio sp. TB]SEP96294.1 hypothetical protein SAMN02910382_01558 [Butyrivibrio sp. TB]
MIDIMNKKQILKAAVFAIIFIFLIRSVTYVLRTNGDVKDRFTGFYAEPDNSIDAVVIGSSPVYPAIVTPKIYGDTGITVYPLSSNMQRPVAGMYLVKEAQKTQSPELYIFEMRMYTANEEDIIGNMAHTREVTDNMKYSMNRIDTINAMVDDKSQRLTYYFDIFKYHSNWKTLFMWSQLRDFNYEYPDDLKGYVVYDQVGPTQSVDVSDIEGDRPIQDKQEKALRDLLEYLSDNDLQGLFIVLPELMTEDSQKKYNYMKTIIESYGYNFLNMNDYYEEIGIDFETDFRDYGNHTNALGAVKVTDYLEEYLVTHYQFIDDHRLDGNYSSWDDAYKLWQEEYTNAKETIDQTIADKNWYEPEIEE